MPMSQPHDRVHAFATLLAEERLAGDRGFPLKRDIAVFVDELLGILFGQLSESAAGTANELQARLTLAVRDLRRLVAPLAEPGEADRIVDAFAAALPAIHDRLQQDAQAIAEGDPAAESLDEVIAAYPGFLAIACASCWSRSWMAGRAAANASTIRSASPGSASGATRRRRSRTASVSRACSSLAVPAAPSESCPKRIPSSSSTKTATSRLSGHPRSPASRSSARSVAKAWTRSCGWLMGIDSGEVRAAYRETPAPKRWPRGLAWRAGGLRTLDTDGDLRGTRAGERRRRRSWGRRSRESR